MFIFSWLVIFHIKFNYYFLFLISVIIITKFFWFSSSPVAFIYAPKHQSMWLFTAFLWRRNYKSLQPYYASFLMTFLPTCTLKVSSSVLYLLPFPISSKIIHYIYIYPERNCSLTVYIYFKVFTKKGKKYYWNISEEFVMNNFPLHAPDEFLS